MSKFIDTGKRVVLVVTADTEEAFIAAFDTAEEGSAFIHDYNTYHGSLPMRVIEVGVYKYATTGGI